MEIRKIYLEIFKEVADKEATLDFFQGGFTNDYFTSHNYNSYFAGEEKLRNNHKLFSLTIRENKRAIDLFYAALLSPFAKRDLDIFEIGYYFYQNRCLPKHIIQKVNSLLLQKLRGFEKFQIEVLKKLIEGDGYLDYTITKEKAILKKEREKLFKEALPFKEFTYTYSRYITAPIFKGEKCLYVLSDYEAILINHKVVTLKIIPALSSRAGFFEKNGELYYYAGHSQEEKIGECLYYNTNRRGDAIILYKKEGQK
jgi:hypothetical protein